jgi:hypothetical protein
MLLMRRLIVVLCLVAVISAALAPSAHVLSAAILVPLLLFVATIVIVPIRFERENSTLPASPCLSFATSRAPPSA